MVPHTYTYVRIVSAIPVTKHSVISWRNFRNRDNRHNQRLPPWSVVEDNHSLLAIIFPGITTSLDLALFTLLAPSPYITPINLFLALPQKNSYLNWNPFSREVEWIELLNRPCDASGFDLTARKYAHIFPLTKLIIFYSQYDITCRGELFKTQGGLFLWWRVQK